MNKTPEEIAHYAVSEGLEHEIGEIAEQIESYAQSRLKSLEEKVRELEKENEELRRGLALNQGDVAQKEILLEELGEGFSDEIVDRENGNYLKIKVDDIPEEMIRYMD